jgi:hypothetical protein
MREAVLDTALLAAALAASGCGFACLALAMPRHWADVAGTAPPTVTLTARRSALLRIAGAAALALSFALALLRDGASFGSLLGLLVWSLGAVGVALTLTWRPHWLRCLTLSPTSTD